MPIVTVILAALRPLLVIPINAHQTNKAPDANSQLYLRIAML